MVWHDPLMQNAPRCPIPGIHPRTRGLPPSGDVAAAIAKLDAVIDAHTILQLLTNWEFPFDIVRANELALFHTYGSRSISTLLDRTGEFSRAGQKRYDDTRLLVGQFMEAAVDDERHARSIAQMNHIHSFYGIPNDDYLFVLWTFIDFPIQWMNDFGRRAFTPHEQAAWFNAWRAIGEKMGLQNIPVDKAAFDAFVANYEAREFVPCEASRRVAGATVAVMQAWLPQMLRKTVVPVASCLMRPQLRTTLGYAEPPSWLNRVVRGVLKVRAKVKRVVSGEQHPSFMASSINRTYPGNRYTIETLGPSHAHRAPSSSTSSSAL
jgi:hypothetical protein